MPQHTGFNADQVTKDATGHLHSSMVATSIQTTHGAASSERNKKKRKHRPETEQVEGEGMSLEVSRKKKKKRHHRVSEETTGTLLTESVVASSDISRHYKERQKHTDAHVAETSLHSAAEPTKGGSEKKSRKTKKKSGQREVAENVVPPLADETLGVSEKKVDSTTSAVPQKRKNRAANHNDSLDKSLALPSPLPAWGTDNVADPIQRPVTGDTPPATETQPKTKSKKSKKHRINEADADNASAHVVDSTSSAHVATTNLDTANLLAPAALTSLPTVEQLAEYDNPEDLLRALSRPNATSSEATTGDITNATAGRGKKLGRQTRPSNPAFTSTVVPVQSNDDDSNSILWMKWLSAGEMKKVCEESGIKYKQGKFTQLESERVAQALEKYRVANGLSNDSLTELMYAKRGQQIAQREKFWQDITRAVPGRSLLAVYHYVRRKYNPLGNQGPWTEEEDNKLRSAVRELGTRWNKVSARVGRHAGDCRDRYRNHIAHKGNRVDGPWSKEDEDLLAGIVKSLTFDQGKDLTSEVPWSIVSERMGYRRSRNQCRIKWQDGLSKRMKWVNTKDVSRWGAVEQFCLVQELKDIQVNDDSEIDWNQLTSKARWNHWSSHDVRRRWKTLMKGIDGHENMTFTEIMEVLKVKFAEPPPNATFVNGCWVATKRHRADDGKAYRSKSVISDSSSESDS